MIYRIFYVLLISLFAVSVHAQVEPYDLTVEYMTEPVGLDEAAPRLSWKSRATEPGLKNVMQSAYRVLVASTPEILAQDKGDLWDSGKVESDQSLNIEYAGAPLKTSQRCYWKVEVSYKTPTTTLNRYSGASRWTMGVMHPEDWKAKWIGAEEKTRKNWLSKETRWIWPGHAESLEKAPPGKTYYRKVFSSDEINPDKDFQSLYAVLKITADDSYEVFLNGKKITQTWGHFNDWRWMRFVFLPAESIKRGDNLLAVAVTNKEPGPTALLVELMTEFVPGPTGPGAFVLSGDNTWLASTEPAEGWNSDPNFQNEKWKAAVEVGPVDCQPWGKIRQDFELNSPAFGKSFNVDKKVETATLHITGLGFYEASLNGKRIGNKVLDPMQTRYDKRVLYSTYDLTDSLKQGENRLNVLVGHGWYDVRSVAVWNFDNAPWRDYPRMISQLEIVFEDGSKEMILSDDTWEHIDSPIGFDCIRQGEISRSSNNEAIGRSAIVEAPKGKLVAEAVPASVIAQELKPVKITEPKPGVYVVDFGQNIAGWLRMKFDEKTEAVHEYGMVKFRYAERLGKDGNVEMKPINEHFRHKAIYTFPYFYYQIDQPDDMFQTDLFFRNPGTVEQYEPRFMYHGFQHVEITGLKQPPTPDMLTACMVHNDFKTVGKFECSNELFNKIQAATVLSYKGNFVNGVPTDCPHREKNGWTGDAHLACTQAQYNFDNTACYEKWIYDLMDEQQPDGNLPGIVPTSGWGYAWGNGPAWDSAICIIPWELYEYKGDRRILERAYPAMKKYVDYLQTREHEDGLVYHGLSDWCVAKTQTEAVVTSSVYYFIDAEIVARAAFLLGKEDDAEKYFALAQKIASAYCKKFLQDDGTIANGSQTAQSFPLYYDIVFMGLLEQAKSGKKFPFEARLVEAVEKADNHLDVGILGAKSLFRALSKIGRTDLAVKILNQKTSPGYGDWFERGATTLWEDWGDGASRNHVMYGDVSAWFFETLAGISSNNEQAFKDVIISPGMIFDRDFPEGIDWVKAEHDSPYGPIKVDWKREGKKIRLNVSVPVNTTADIVTGFPKEGRSSKRFGSGDYSFELGE